MSGLIGKLGLISCVGLLILLCFSLYKTKNLEVILGQKNEEIIALDFSSKAGETTLKAILENEKNNNERIKELEKERILLKNQSKIQKQKLEGFIQHDEKSNKWAKQEIPSNILSLLLDNRT